MLPEGTRTGQPPYTGHRSTAAAAVDDEGRRTGLLCAAAGSMRLSRGVYAMRDGLCQHAGRFGTWHVQGESAAELRRDPGGYTAHCNRCRCLNTAARSVRLSSNGWCNAPKPPTRPTVHSAAPTKASAYCRCLRKYAAATEHPRPPPPLAAVAVEPAAAANANPQRRRAHQRDMRARTWRRQAFLDQQVHPTR